MTKPKFPDIHVKLVGKDGNAMTILASMRHGLSRGGATGEQISEFMNEAMSGDYNHLLGTCMNWVNVS